MQLKDKKVLVTGAGGFIGSHLTERLVVEGCKVKAFIRYNSKNSWGWLEESAYKNDIEIYTGDIRDHDSVKDAMKGIDIVFHLAALIGIPYSYISPLAYIKTNIEGAYNVLQSARELGTERIIHTSTSEVYGTALYVPIDEKHPLQPQSPYSASKIGADKMAESFYYSFSLPVVIARPFNTYGPRQSARAVIPTIITQLLSGKTKIRLGNTAPTRDLNFVKDTVEGFLEIAKNDAFIGDTINIGTGSEISISDLAHKIAESNETKIVIENDNQRVRPENSEVERLLADNKKIISNTNWRPGYSLEKGLSETIEWFRERLSRYKAEIYNV